MEGLPSRARLGILHRLHVYGLAMLVCYPVQPGRLTLPAASRISGNLSFLVLTGIIIFWR